MSVNFQSYQYLTNDIIIFITWHNYKFFCYSSAERRKKIDEHYQAEEDLAMARQRREKEKYEKLEEQQRVGNHHMILTEQNVDYSAVLGDWSMYKWRNTKLQTDVTFHSDI